MHFHIVCSRLIMTVSSSPSNSCQFTEDSLRMLAKQILFTVKDDFLLSWVVRLITLALIEAKLKCSSCVWIHLPKRHGGIQFDRKDCNSLRKISVGGIEDSPYCKCLTRLIAVFLTCVGLTRLRVSAARSLLVRQTAFPQ